MFQNLNHGWKIITLGMVDAMKHISNPSLRLDKQLILARIAMTLIL